MINFSYTVFIVLIPIFMFLLIGFFGMKFKPLVSGIVGTTGLGVSFILSWYTAYQYFFMVPKVAGAFPKLIAYNTVWLRFTDTLHIDMGVLLDPISVMMLEHDRAGELLELLSAMTAIRHRKMGARVTGHSMTD